MRAPIILVEGLDRSGKSTQVSQLANQLDAVKRPYKIYKFPDRTTQIGTLINRYLVDRDFHLSNESIHLLFSANRWELKEEIIQNVESGITVIMDRYVYSGVAYSCAKGMDFQWCYNCDIGLPKPDVTLFLYVSDNAAREDFGNERYESVVFQEKVAEVFKRFYENKEWVFFNVDGKSIEEVRNQVWSKVSNLIKGIDGDIAVFS